MRQGSGEIQGTAQEDRDNANGAEGRKGSAEKKKLVQCLHGPSIRSSTLMGTQPVTPHIPMKWVLIQPFKNFFNIYF